MFPFSKNKPLLDEDSQHRVVAAIGEAESKTSGEIRVYMEHNCSYMDAMHRAQELFGKLHMHKTYGHNAVLVYLAITDRQFAIFGDKEIYHRAGGAQFWEAAAQQMKSHLKNGQITEGLVTCIQELGKALTQHFPHDPAIKKNELPDEIVFGK
jgi:uncharacterized membrane protein